MSDNPLDKFDRQSLEKSADGSPLAKFVDSLVNRPTKREYKRILAESLTLREKLESKTSELEKLRSENQSELERLRLENQELSSELKSVKRESWRILIFSTASSIFIAYGVNLVSGNLNQGWGLFLIILGVAFAILAWIFKLK